MRHVERRQRALLAEIEQVLNTRRDGRPLHVAAGLVGIAEHLRDRVVCDHAQSAGEPLFVLDLQRVVAGVANVHRRPVAASARVTYIGPQKAMERNRRLVIRGRRCARDDPVERVRHLRVQGRAAQFPVAGVELGEA